MTMMTPQQIARDHIKRAELDLAPGISKLTEENDSLALLLSVEQLITEAIEADRAQRDICELEDGRGCGQCGDEVQYLSSRDLCDGCEAEGGVIRSPQWPDGCPMTLDELPNGDTAPGHVNCSQRGVRVFASRKTNSDPMPHVGWSGRRYDDDSRTWAALDDGPVSFDPRPEYDNSPNPLLVEFREEGDSAAEWLECFAENEGFRENIEVDFSPEQVAHAVKVLARLAVLTEGE